MSRSSVVRREAQSEDFVPYVEHHEHWALALDSGAKLGGFHVPGRAWETADPGDVFAWHSRLNQTMRSIHSAQLVLSSHVVRTLADGAAYPKGDFRSAFARGLDASYRDRLLDRRLYRNDLYLFVVMQPFAATLRKGLPAWLKREKTEEDQAEGVRALGEKLTMMEADLKGYGIRRLGTRREGNVLYSEIAEALHTILTTERRKIPVTTGRISRGIYNSRVIVGWETIEIRTHPASQYASAFVMYEYPTPTEPGLFNNLLSAPYSFVLSQSFACLPKASGHNVITRKQNQMRVGGDKAISQREELTQAADDLASNRFTMGTHHLSLVVYADSVKALQKVNARAISDLADSGAVATHAHLELTGAYWAQLPGNMALRPRPGAITSRNFVGMAPLHNYPTGEQQGFWGEPLALFRTNGGTAYSYHPHYGDLGNTIITGPAGTGKTTVLNFLLAEAERTGAQTVLWDKDRGCEIACRARDGNYLVLPNGRPTGCAPLKALDGSGPNIAFLAALVRGLIVGHSSYEITDDDNRRIIMGLRMMMRLPPAARSFRELRAFLGVTDPEGAGARLERWAEGRELGWVLDNETDDIDLSAAIIGFDMTSVLDNPEVRGPLMAYLFHRCESLIDGRRVIFAIDEFWKALLDPAFRNLVHDKLKTLRKRNAPMFLATQSARDALNSPIAHTIIEQCPNQIHMPNPRADAHDFIDGLKLTEPEFYQIKEGMLSGGRSFLLKQGSVSAVCELDLSACPDQVAVLSARESTVRLMERLIAEHGPKSEAWLPAFYQHYREVIA